MAVGDEIQNDIAPFKITKGGIILNKSIILKILDKDGFYLQI